MKTTLPLLILILMMSCAEKHDQKNDSLKKKETTEKQIIKSSFQSILDSAKVKGSILLFDAQSKSFYSNDFNWAKRGQLPASTFKIPNSIIALETGVVENDSTLLKWDGEQKMFDIWEQDLIFKKAFHYSCVPCYQEIARKIGPQRMRDYLDTFDYGSILFDSTDIDMFWLQGKSRINQFQQIDFLRRFYQSELPIKKRTDRIMKNLIVIDKNDAYQLSGKTGLSISGNKYNGWFVGYIESKNKLYYFATNIEPKENLDRSIFQRTRKEVTFEAFREMGVIKAN